MKKSLSIILSVLMALSVFSLMPFPIIFSGKSYMSIVELIKLGIGISKTINVTVFML